MAIQPALLGAIYKDYVLPGLVAVLGAIPEIRRQDVGNPRSIDVPPQMSHIFQRRTEAQEGQVVAIRYETLHTIYVRLQDPQAAEHEIAGLADAISGWLFANPTLDGAIGHGGCGGICMGGRVGLIEQTHKNTTFGQSLYTVIDATSEVLIKIGVSHVRTL